MKLAYCFTIRILDESIGTLDLYKTLLQKSIYSGMQFNSVTLYTDKETIPHLRHIQCNKVIVDTTGFFYLDDFKVVVLSMIDSDTTLVDTDVVFWNPLDIPDGYDVYVDRKEDFIECGYDWHHKHFIDKDVLDVYPQFLPIPNNLPNIGILYFKNNTLKKSYIKLYWKIRNWLLDDKFWYKEASIILGQYLLGTIIESDGYTPYYLFNNADNLYSHYAGSNKFKDLNLDDLKIDYTPPRWI